VTGNDSVEGLFPPKVFFAVGEVFAHKIASETSTVHKFKIGSTTPALGSYEGGGYERRQDEGR
jgi:hypothetical protein